MSSLVLVGHDQGAPRYFWRWEGARPSQATSFTVAQEPLDAALVLVREATPESRKGEAVETMLTRVLTTGALANKDAERAMATALADALLPQQLQDELIARFHENGDKPVRLRLMPPASCARIPWHLLVVRSSGHGRPEEYRLAELADILHEVPAGLHAGRARVPASAHATDADARALYVVDPRTFTSMGQVLDRSGLESLTAAFGPTAHADSAFSGTFDRRSLQRGLNSIPPPSRLVYVGHVVAASDSPGSAALLLSDSAESYGVTSLIEEFARPLSALDLLEGTTNGVERVDYMEEREGISRNAIVWPAMRGSRQAGSDIWPMPPRVVLLACSSGGDLGNVEPFGLAMAMVNSGAEYISATKWSLPTDQAFATYGGDSSHPLVRTALALDEAHQAPDPVVAVAAWQRAELRTWLDGESGSAVPPLLSAAVDTFVGSAKSVATAV